MPYNLINTQQQKRHTMSEQAVNHKLWSKLFVDIGVLGISAKTGVAIATLYKIKNDSFVPAPRTQRKLRDSLNIPIDEMFPFLSEEDEAA